MRVSAVSAFSWLRRPRCSTSPPESLTSASAGASSRRPASSSDSLSFTAARRLRRGLSSALLCVPLLALLATGAAAQTVVPDDWPLKPSGLSAGDQFRLMFVTSTTRDASSTDIADYNSFVQGRAAAGHTSIQSYSAQFRALGSTATVDARDNASTTGTGVPIYWLGGAKIADSYTDFYDGNWDSAMGDGRNESGGSASSVSVVFVGSEDNGTKDSNNFTLGSTADFVRVSNPRTPSQGLRNGGALAETSETHRFYGLSPVFEVAPTTTTELSIGAPADADEGNLNANDRGLNGEFLPVERDLTFTVNLGTAISRSVAFEVCFSGTARIKSTLVDGRVAFSDYQPLISGSPRSSNCLTAFVLAGSTSSTAIGIRVKGDTVFEPDETVTATLKFRGTPPPGVTLGTRVATHTIRNDDPNPDRSGTVRITGGPAVTEGQGAVFTVTANPAPREKLAVRLAVTDASESPITDFLRLADEGFTAVAIEPGQTTATLTVPTVNDGDYEPDGTVSARILTPGSGWRVGTTFYRLQGSTEASVTVQDDDTAPTPHAPPAVIVSTEYDELLSAGNAETGALASFCFAVGGPFADNVDGTHNRSVPATMPSHFNVNYEIVSSTGKLTSETGRVYKDGRMSGALGISTGEVRTTVKVDNTDLSPDPATEDKVTAARLKACTSWIRTGDEDATLTAKVLPSLTKDYRTGVGIATYAVGDPSTATITVVRPQMSPPVVPPAGQQSTVTISADLTSVTEGGDVTFTVTADPAPAQDLAVNLSADWEMGAGDDRTGGGDFWTVTVRAGAASATWTYTTTSDDDDLAHGTVVGRVEAGDGYEPGEPSSVTLTLLDDDEPTTDGVVQHNVPDSVVVDPVTPAVDPALVAQVRDYAAETWKHPDHVDRWMRVLAAFGDDNGYTAMTAAEAQTHADKGWQRWVPVVAALNALEAVGSQQDQQDTDQQGTDQQVVTPEPPAVCVSPELLSDVEGYAGETHEGAAHIERWLRVLHTLKGMANDSTIMLSAEAQTYADQGWQRWVPVVTAIECLEAGVGGN